jgi:16S rRNA (guanine527-N7)-methyltransferase
VGLTEAIDAAAAGVSCALEPGRRMLLARYATLVFKWNRIANLTGAMDAATFVERHLADSLALTPHIAGSHVTDIGSGVGLPGIVLACLRPDWQVTLIEPRGKRARFLAQAGIELALANVQVIATRVEHWRPEQAPDTLVSQAVASLGELLRLTSHLHAPGLRLIVMKGEDPEPEIAELAPAPCTLRVAPLAVPGRRARHLVIIDW